MNPQLYPLSSFLEKQEKKEEEEDPNLKLYIFSSTSQLASSSSSSASQLPNFATSFSSATQHDQRGNNLHHHLQESNDHQAEKSIGGSREDSEAIFSSTSLVKSSVSSCNIIDIDHEEVEDQINKQENGSAKYWMSSKMRLMQKMMIKTDKKVGAISDPKATRNSNNNNNNIQNNLGNNQGYCGEWEIRGRSSCNSNGHNNGIRVCSDCKTTTTPLWRSGPQGPKSLCNACGIRQRKARRAMAEAANGGGGSVVVASEAAGWRKELHKEKKSRLSCHGDVPIVGHVKNKCSKMGDNSWESQSEAGRNDVSFDHNFTLRLRKSGSAFGRVFPRDEEEAAILLMELSCGLVHSC